MRLRLYVVCSEWARLIDLAEGKPLQRGRPITTNVPSIPFAGAFAERGKELVQHEKEIIEAALAAC